MNIFKIVQPSTVLFTFDEPPQYVNVYLKNELYYFRNLGGKFYKIKFNVKHPGKYFIDVDCANIKVIPIEITPLNFELPEPDRQRLKPFQFIYNSELTGTPARNYTNTGIIEYSSYFKTLPFPLRLFILLHEIGHFYYKDEENADAYAAKVFIDNGYNESTAIYALTKVLHPTDKNEKRILSLFKKITND